MNFDVSYPFIHGVVGASRGFAFVEFQLLSEAVRWKELTKVLCCYLFLSSLFNQTTLLPSEDLQTFPLKKKEVLVDSDGTQIYFRYSFKHFLCGT